MPSSEIYNKNPRFQGQKTKNTSKLGIGISEEKKKKENTNRGGIPRNRNSSFWLHGEEDSQTSLSLCVYYMWDERVCIEFAMCLNLCQAEKTV